LCGPPEVFGVVAAFALGGLADLHEELSGLRELQDHRVIGIRNRGPGLLFILYLLSTCGRRRTARSALAARGGIGIGSQAISADPDVAFVIDRDAVIGVRPIVSLSRSAPTRDQRAFL